METATAVRAPMRITDIVDAKSSGADVAVTQRFEIRPVDFHHGAKPFKAYIFLAHYRGTIDGTPFEFRKCYARGCPNNLCPHVSQAVTIANRYLQRDYHALKKAGIAIDEPLFTLDGMVVRFDALKQSEVNFLTVAELVDMAAGGPGFTVSVALELVPAVEHFAHQKKAHTFLSGEMAAQIAKRRYICHRCFACFPSDAAKAERALAVQVANERLSLVYDEFDRVKIACNKIYFR